MKILVVSIYFPPELTGIAKYSGEMVDWLVDNGHQVQVITTPPFYPEWKVEQPYKAYKYSVEKSLGLTIWRCPVFVPQRLSAVKRIAHFLSFTLFSFPIFCRMAFFRPDLVINPVPPLLVSPWCWLLSKLTGAKSVLHIQDFEVDAMLGLGMTKSSFLASAAKRFESWMLGRFNYVSTISYSMMEKAAQKGVDSGRLVFFPNWSDVSKFEAAEKDPVLLASLGVPNRQKVVLYSGNIGDKQGLEIVLHAAETLSDDGYYFLIVGEGAGKDRLERAAIDMGLLNVAFAPLQPVERLPSLLASADCHLVVQKRGIADLVMPSKITNILAVGGNAVITADEDTELGRLCVNVPGIATLVEPESVSALIDGIKHAVSSERPNHIAAKYAKQHIDKDEVLSAFIANFTSAKES